MANIIKLILEGSDQTGPAFQSATKNAQIMSANLRGAGGTFRAFSDIASSVGATALIPLAGAFEHASMQAGALVGKLKDSKLAVTALAAGVAAAGFQAGNTVASWLGFSGENQDAATAFNDRFAAIVQQIQAAKQKLTGGDSLSNELQKINEAMETIGRSVEAKGAFGGPSFLGGKTGLKQEEVDQLLEKYRQLRDIVSKASEAEAMANDSEQFEAAKAKWNDLIQVKYAAQDATLGLMNAETMRHQKALEEIGQLVTTEQEKDSLIEAEVQATEARKAQIKKEYADKQAQIAADLARKEQQTRQATFSATAGLFGSLAGLAAAQGRKGFALAQGFRYAETIVNTAAGVGRALADYPWPASVVIGALVAAAGAVQLATIASAKPSGQAHAGLTSIAESGSFNLIRGERVVAPNQNADLTEFLEAGRGGRNVTVNFHMDGMMLGKAIGQLSRDGRLEIDARSVV